MQPHEDPGRDPSNKDNSFRHAARSVFSLLYCDADLFENVSGPELVPFLARLTDDLVAWCRENSHNKEFLRDYAKATREDQGLVRDFLTKWGFFSRRDCNSRERVA